MRNREQWNVFEHQSKNLTKVSQPSFPSSRKSSQIAEGAPGMMQCRSTTWKEHAFHLLSLHLLVEFAGSMQALRANDNRTTSSST